MTENGSENGDNNDSQRDEKGRFVKGGPGGPGRGKKSDSIDLDGIDFWTELANKFAPDLNSKSDSTRQRAGKILIELKKLKDAFELKRGDEDKFANV